MNQSPGADVSTTRRWLMVLPIVLMVYLAGACEKKGTSSVPTDPTDEYRVFMKEAHNPGWIYAYRPVSNEVDSFYWLISGDLRISADGQKLYGRPDGCVNAAVVQFDSIRWGDSLCPDCSLPFKEVISVSSDNELLAVVAEDNGFSIVRTADYSVVFHDTDRVVEGVFASGSQRFYGGAVHVDLHGSPGIIRRWSCPFGLLYGLVPSEDESLWYLYVKVSSHFDFEFIAYDREADSVLFRQHLTPGYGEIELGPDPTRVFFTNAGQGCIHSGPYPPPFFHIYDSETNTASDTVWTLGACPEVGTLPISEVEFTADGRWLVAIHAGFGAILTYDARNLEFKHCYFLGHGYCLSDLVTQRIPYLKGGTMPARQTT
jgi:hypothetical protein